MKPVRKNLTVARAEQSRHCRITNSVNSGDTRMPGKPTPKKPAALSANHYGLSAVRVAMSASTSSRSMPSGLFVRFIRHGVVPETIAI